MSRSVTASVSLLFAALTALACWDQDVGPTAPPIGPMALLTTAASGTEVRITTNAAHQEMPDISGDRIVWWDGGSGNNDIYMYDLSTGVESQITTNTASQASPVISGDRIAWSDTRNGNVDVYMYDLSTGVESQITTNTASQDHPAISGDRIAWSDTRNGNWDIYMYDLSTGLESQVTTDPANQLYPELSGGRIVWQDYRHGDPVVYLYDTSTAVESRLTLNPDPQYLPKISGDRIVWYSIPVDPEIRMDVYLYDLSTSVESRITTNPGSHLQPAISGDRIVWADTRNGNYDIYMYDLSTGKESSITTGASFQYLPAISGDRVVWQDARNGNWDIYMYELSPPGPGLSEAVWVCAEAPSGSFDFTVTGQIVRPPPGNSMNIIDASPTIAAGDCKKVADTGKGNLITVTELAEPGYVFDRVELFYVPFNTNNIVPDVMDPVIYTPTVTRPYGDLGRYFVFYNEPAQVWPLTVDVEMLEWPSGKFGLRVTVTDTQTGSPAAGETVLVEILQGSWGDGSTLSREGPTNADGVRGPGDLFAGSVVRVSVAGALPVEAIAQ